MSTNDLLRRFQESRDNRREEAALALCAECDKLKAEVARLRALCGDALEHIQSWGWKGTEMWRRDCACSRCVIRTRLEDAKNGRATV